ncbi:MAG: hypothetical protein WDO74_30495 [Pseudomonadota bacterium]
MAELRDQLVQISLVAPKMAGLVLFLQTVSRAAVGARLGPAE